MQFYTHHPMVDYHNAMDTEKYVPTQGEELNLSVKDVGMSVPMGISATNVSGIYSKIRMGAGSIEIGFPGVGVGQRQAQTPGMYGEDQRQAIRELAKINEINLTTHAPYGIMGMMGRDERGNFSINNANEQLREIRRAIDFAADTAGGGSVVVHTGEWDRPMIDMTLGDYDWDRTNLGYDKDGRVLFKTRFSELHDANYVLLDSRTSQKFETVMREKKVAVPLWRRASKNNPETAHLVGKKGVYQDMDFGDEKWMNRYKGKGKIIEEGDYLDYEDNVIIDPYNPKFGRVPEFDEKTSRFKVDYMHFTDFKEEAKEQTEFNRKHWFDKNPGKTKEFRDRWGFLDEIHPDEAYLRTTLETNEGHSRGWALQYAERTNTHLAAIKKLKEAKAFYEKLDKSLPEEEKWKIMKQDSYLHRAISELIPPETKHPLDMINKTLEEQRISLEFARQASASQQQQAEDTAETKKHMQTPVKRFQLHVARMYGEAGIRAMQRSKDPNNPVVLTVENLFPTRFGGHPQELKFVIDQSRKWFADLLTEKETICGRQTRKDQPYEFSMGGKSQYYTPGMSREEAEKLAEKHVKATLDTGHLNLWRKFWQSRQGQGIEEADKEFKEWYLKEVDMLAKGGYISNVHLTDNYGIQDDHLAPGQGTTPIKEVISILRKNGYDKAITVEPGADASTDVSDFHGLMKTWRYLGSPIYGIGGGSPGGGGIKPKTWGEVQYSYFGQNQPPYFVFGSYAPSNDWTLWTQVPME